LILDEDLGHADPARETAGAPRPSRPGAHTAVRPSARRSEATGEGGRVLVMSKPEDSRTFARKAARFSLMSAAIIAVSLLTAALFEALVPDTHFSPTSYLPHIAVWMAGAIVGLAAGIAALFKAGTSR
jgi:hypothetical protein